MLIAYGSLYCNKAKGLDGRQLRDALQLSACSCDSWLRRAGVLLVLEAGGEVTLMDGRPFALTPKLNLVASNGRIHTQMVAVLENIARD